MKTENKESMINYFTKSIRKSMMAKSLLPLILMLAFSVDVSAYDFKVNGLCYNKCPDSDNVMVTCEIIWSSSSYISLKGDIIIPVQVSYKGKSFVVTMIDSLAFEGCTGLTSVTIPNSVTEIGEAAFESCTGLTSITIPNSVTEIGDFAFGGCTGLTSVKIPKSVTEIGAFAFAHCTGLTSITIPNSVTMIDRNVFKGCTGLTSVTISESVEEIGGNAFKDCPRLTKIICKAKTPPSFETETASLYVHPPFDDFYKPTVYVPAESIENYINDDDWKEFVKIRAIE